MTTIDQLYISLDDSTQFKIFDRLHEAIEKIETEKNAVVNLLEKLEEITVDALSENATECDCGCPADQMEWQDFDKVFICPECGENN